jgi:hypothetical protein
MDPMRQKPAPDPSSARFLCLICRTLYWPSLEVRDVVLPIAAPENGMAYAKALELRSENALECVYSMALSRNAVIERPLLWLPIGYRTYI